MDSAFWTPLLGLGIPQPFVPSFVLHPLAPLLAWIPPIPWVRLLLIAHSVVGAIGMWLVGAVLGLPPIVRATGVVTFLLAAPVQNYVLSDFWPSHHVVWTLLPWVFLMTWRVLDPAISHSSARRWAGGLGLVSGIIAANANPAYLIVFVPLAVAVLGVPWRTTMRRAGWIAAAALIAGAISAPIIVHLVTEWPYFDPELERPNIQDPLPLRALWTALAHPFVAEPTTRTLFFGAPYTALALIGCTWFARRRLDLVVGFLVSLMLLFTTWVPMPLVSQRYQFRDPVTFCGLLLAGLALSRIIAGKGSWDCSSRRRPAAPGGRGWLRACPRGQPHQGRNHSGWGSRRGRRYGAGGYADRSHALARSPPLFAAREPHRRGTRIPDRRAWREHARVSRNPARERLVQGCVGGHDLARLQTVLRAC